MKESLYKIQKLPIFSETFTDEETTRSIGGIPTSVTYDKGVASCLNASSSRIYYPNRPLKGTYSVRIRFNSLTLALNQYFVDFRNLTGTGTGYILQDPTTLGTLNVPSGTRYVDGVASSTITANSKEIIVTGMTISSFETLLNSRFSITQSQTINYELFEIYEGTLTAQEVKNLSENDRYKSPKLNEILNVDGKNGTIANKYAGDAQSTTNLVSGGDFTSWSGTFPNESPASWSVFGTPSANNYLTQSPSGACRIVCLDGSAIGISQLILTVGKTYKLSFDNISLTGTAEITGLVNNTFTSATLPLGKSTFISIATTTTLTFKRGSNCNWAFDNIVLQEVVPTVVNTAVNSVRSDGINVMDFNAPTSKLDCGSYNKLSGDMTFISWIKNRTLGSTASTRILDNGMFYLYVTTPSIYKCTSNNSVSAANSPSNSLLYGIYQMLVVTRTSTGVTNFYINGVLSGTANQSSGTPADGVSNICIGNRATGDRTFDGIISGARIINGILSVEEISQLFSNERRNYGV